jgi:trigger factor
MHNMNNGEEFLREMKRPTELKRVLEFEVPRARVEKEIQGIIDGIRREVSLPGFRKGKAPLDVVKARFAKSARKEAIEKLIPEAYRRALEMQSLKPVLPAEISGVDYGREGPLRFRAEVEVFPKVATGNYKGIRAKKESRSVEEGDIDREIDALRERFARFEEVDRPAEEQDTVIADYWRLGAEGRPVKGSKVSNYPFDLTAPGLMKEFKDALKGVEVGEKKTVVVTYSDDFAQEEMRGRRVTFVVEPKKVGGRRLPEVDEGFVKMMGVDSVEELRRKVGEGLEQAMEQEADSKIKRDILNKVIEGSDFEVPEGLVKMGLDSIMKSYVGEAQEADADSGGKIKKAREQLRPLAVNLVKEQFIIDDIAEREGITVDEAQVEEMIKTISQRSGLSLEETRRRAAESEEMDRWRRDILRNKVLDFLMEHAKVEE